jgi:hypothetical protein
MQTTPPRIVPWRGLLAVAGLALALLLFGALRDTFDPLRRSEAARLAEQRAAVDQQLTTVDVFVAAFWRLALPALGLGLAGAGAYVGLVIIWRRWGDHRYIEAFHVTQLARVQHQPELPQLQTLTVQAPPRPARELPAIEEAPPAPQLPSPIPSFGELLDQGTIGPNRPLILGFDVTTGQAIEGSWQSLYTAGIGGLQGSGKTWAAVYLLCQSALMGGKLIIADPHAGDDESLAARCAPLRSAMLCDVASDERDILAALKLADSKLQGRKSGQIAGRWPIVLAVDEWLALRRGTLADELPPLVEGFSTEGRKLGCFALLLAQRWNVSVIGEFRNTLASSYVYRMRPAEVRMMTGLLGDEVPSDTLSLAPGECYLLDTRGDCRKIVIPHMTPADVERVGQLLDQVNRPAQRPIGFRLPATQPLPTTPAAASPVPLTEAVPKPFRSGNEAAAEAASTAPQSYKSLSPEAARVYAAWRAGKDVTELAKEANNGSTSGDGYKKALRQINDLLRQATPEEA